MDIDDFIGIIPARYASTRFPGKPLADLGGKPIIQHVYERASKVLKNVLVATDDERILDVVKSFGGKVAMTSPDHPSGTDRVREAFEKSGTDAKIVINIQGDEPFIDPRQIRLLMKAFESSDTQIATLARQFDGSLGFEALENANLVKVTFSDNGKALYFSRSVIPFVRGEDKKDWTQKQKFYIHVGIYAYRATVLQEITRLKTSSLEMAESLEQLRWLQNGYNINVSITEHRNIGIDTPADLENARKLISQYI